VKIICVPKTSLLASGKLQAASPRFVSIKELGVLYGVKMSAVYSFIKTEPDFPYINVGVKKKFLIDVVKFEMWLTERTKKQKRDHFAIPCAVDLMKAFKAGVGK
jgi:hypothetical protein